MYRMVIDNTVSQLRQNLGLTQEQLAVAVGVSRQTIIAIEKGNYTPSLALALKIGCFFGLPVEKIFKVK